MMIFHGDHIKPSQRCLVNAFSFESEKLKVFFSNHVGEQFHIQCEIWKCAESEKIFGWRMRYRNPQHGSTLRRSSLSLHFLTSPRLLSFGCDAKLFSV